MFDFFRRRKKTDTSIKTPFPPSQKIELRPVKPNLYLDVTPEEKEIVSVITSAIVSSDAPNAELKITSVSEIDLDKEMAVALVGAVLAEDAPSSTFRLKRITQITPISNER